MKKTLVAAALTAGMAFALAAGSSSAHNSSAQTGVEDLTAEMFQGRPPTEISGKLSSKNRRCKRGRRVTAYHDVPPDGPGPEDFPLGSDLTDDSGEFGFTTQFAPDKVYVVVEPRVSEGKGHRHRCKRRTSKTVPVGAYK